MGGKIKYHILELLQSCAIHVVESVEKLTDQNNGTSSILVRNLRT
jgi:hypothetical protein